MAIQKGDFLGSGVPYWPVELATLAAYARLQGDAVFLIDLFGINPSRLTDMDDHYLQGESVEKYLENCDVRSSEAFVLYAISYMSHGELLAIVAQLKKSFPKIPIAILENSQSVTAYALDQVAVAFFQAGANLLICGEPYFNWDLIKRQLIIPTTKPVPHNLVTRESTHTPARLFVNGFRYPVPAWDLVNLAGYWSLPYSHGPKTPKYLPVLTSRGCPYPCNFCVVPGTNRRKWRGNDPEQVVEELITLRDRFNVHDFQIEDLNSTVQHQRWEKICELLIEQHANVRFYFVSGTKAETFHIEKVPLFAKAGCRYVSISPETGSKDLMKLIGKPFDYQHGIDLITACRKYGIRTQACLLVGHPDETEASQKASEKYLAQMVKSGLDEVAVFVVASFAGSVLYARRKISLQDQTALPSFSPKGRVGYETFEQRRKSLIRIFFMNKLRRGIDIWAQGVRALFGMPQTKMENLPRRVAYIYWLIFQYTYAKKIKGL